VIFYLCMSDNFRPFGAFLRAWGGPVRHRVRMLAYEERPDPGALPDASYVFADVDRMPPRTAEIAASLWKALAERGERVRLLNRPGVSLSRYELLRALHARGQNDFRGFRTGEPRERIRFPVFVRSATEHEGAATPLLADHDALERALRELASAGHSPDSLLIVEFSDVLAGGFYRKYAAFRLGPALIAHHIFFQREWEVKGPSLFSPEMLEEERIFQEGNPHAAQLYEVFELAGVDYGRIDYGVARDGTLRIWEVNSNPSVMRPQSFYQPIQLPGRHRFVDRYLEALAALDDRSPSPRLDYWLGRLRQGPFRSRKRRRFV
jgi:hypothetical protein